MTFFKLLKFIPLFVLSSAALAEQSCLSNALETTPENRFVISKNTVLDKKTGLTWQRCTLGLSGSACNQGVAKKYTWNQALNAATKGWRLPNVKELASIIELKCYEPAINLNLFPNTKNDYYWTSSPFNGFSYQKGEASWSYNFTTGEDSANLKSSRYMIRLVR